MVLGTGELATSPSVRETSNIFLSALAGNYESELKKIDAVPWDAKGQGDQIALPYFQSFTHLGIHELVLESFD